MSEKSSPKKSRVKKVKNTGRSVRRVLVNLFIIFFVAIYLWLLLPASRFLNNRLPEEDPNREIIAEVDKNDSVLDWGDIMETATPEATESPTSNPESPVPTEEPPATPEFIDPDDPAGPGTSGGGGSSLPYVPDPVVDGVTKANGNSVKLEKDAKNVLVLGVDESAQLTDAMIIVSICERTKEVKAYSLARDAYVPYSQSIKSVINNKFKNSAGIFKLNATMMIGNHIKYSGGKFGNSGVDFLCHVIAEMMPNANIKFDDYVYVGESGFAGLIDVFGGVDVEFYEDWYSASGDEVGKILYTKGVHHLSGREAYNYVKRRGRFGPSGQVSSSGNPYRMSNQLGFLRDCAAQFITVENLGKVPEIFAAASKYIYHSLTVDKILSQYMSFGLGYAKGEYELKMTVVTGKSFVPPGVIPASYVNLMA